jgi:predicted phage-related endonuclease
MTTLTFDTLAYSKKLRSVGFTEEQAEAQAETIITLMTEQLATKTDLKDLRRDIKEVEAGLKRDIKEVEAGLKRDIKELELRIKEVEAGLKRDIAALDLKFDIKMKELEISLKRDMKEMEMSITIKLGAIVTTGIAVVATLVKLL